MDIIKFFGIDDIFSVIEINTGHINRTFIVNDKYILQSLNNDIFKNPEAVMRNIKNIEKAFEKSDKIKVPHYISTNTGNFIRINNQIWRMYEYTPETARDNKNYLTGLAFGTFIRVINNTKLETAIENYHDFGKYLERFNNLNKHIDISKIMSIKAALSDIFDDNMTKRNIHGDAKPANLIISEKCTVIDLDTAMYGYAAIDYGDMVRSVCIGNSPDMSAISDITRGFAEGLGNILNDKEIRSLYYGILWVTAELAVRYLTDCLSDEKYFRSKTSEQCMSRAEELLKQLDMFIKYKNDITKIIYDLFYIFRGGI